MKRLSVVISVLLLVAVAVYAVPVSAQETIATFSLREMTTAQQIFTAAGAASHIIEDDDFANLLPIVGAIAYEALRPDKVENPVEAAVINVFLYYTSRTLTGFLNDLLFRQ